MPDSTIKMRLLGSKGTNKYCLLYADGTMTRFSIGENNVTASRAMTDLFTRYNVAGITAYGESAERWQNKDNSNRIDSLEQFKDDSVGFAEPYVAAEVVTCNALDPKAGYMLLVKDQNIMQAWLKKTSVDYKDVNTGNKEGKYLTLKEYTDEINEVRKSQGLEPIKVNAVRTKANRHQIPVVKGNGNKWKILSGTPWPADRRFKKNQQR